jgi:hypothetical protein
MKTVTKKPSVTDAQKIVDELEAKAAGLAASRTSDERELAEISFAAQVAEDQKSAARLETLKARIVKRGVDAKSLDAALAEAKRRLAAAQDAERLAEEHRVAEELLELSNMMREVGAKADKALKQFIEASNDLKKIIAATNQRALHNPSAQQLQSLGRRAILGELVNSPFAKEFEHVAPRDRQSLALVTEAWASAIERYVSQKLNQGGDAKDVA